MTDMKHTPERTSDDVLRSNNCNTYVMSCYLTRDDLYSSMRGDLRIACSEISALRAEVEKLREGNRLKGEMIDEEYIPEIDGLIEEREALRAEVDEWKAQAERYRLAIEKILREFGTSPDFAKDIVSQVLKRIHSAARAAIKEE